MKIINQLKYKDTEIKFDNTTDLGQSCKKRAADHYGLKDVCGQPVNILIGSYRHQAQPHKTEMLNIMILVPSR